MNVPMTLPATAATARGATRLGLGPVVMSSLVVPSLAATPCLWVAVASRAAGGPGLTVQAVALTGLLASLAGTNAARAHSYASGESVRAAQGRQELCFALCAVGAGLCALTAAVGGARQLGLLTLAATAAGTVTLAGLLRGDRRLLIAGATAASLAWAADLVLLAVLALRGL